MVKHTNTSNIGTKQLFHKIPRVQVNEISVGTMQPMKRRKTTRIHLQRHSPSDQSTANGPILPPPDTNTRELLISKVVLKHRIKRWIKNNINECSNFTKDGHLDKWNCREISNRFLFTIPLLCEQALCEYQAQPFSLQKTFYQHETPA